MPRIEQLPDGTYAKRLTPFESDLLDRLYQEIRDRRNEGALLQGRINELETGHVTLRDEINLLKMELLGLTEK